MSSTTRWSFKANNNSNSNSRSKREGEENGSRIYQMMLQSMQVLPSPDISKSSLLKGHIVDTTDTASPVKKGKRKTADSSHADDSDGSPAKRTRSAAKASTSKSTLDYDTSRMDFT